MDAGTETPKLSKQGDVPRSFTINLIIIKETVEL